MARSIRIDFEGAIHHIYFRGNRKHLIFHDDYDRRKLLFLIKNNKTKYAIKIYAYCLMPNHVHLLIKSGKVHIGEFMKNVLSKYAQYYNKKYSVVGHLTQGRFKNIIVDKDSYFIILINYIHDNPIRAGIVNSREKYFWSSYNEYIYKINIIDLDENNSFIKDKIIGIKKKCESPRAFKIGANQFYGTEKFVIECLKKSNNENRSSVEREKHDIDSIEDYLRTNYGISFDDLRKSRVYTYIRIAVVLLKDRLHLTYSEIGKILRLNFRTIQYHYIKADSQVILDQFDKNRKIGV